ncbi:MAG: hypothetical protein PHX70_06505 [Clostridium sp.]|nr:hypothetical protein [Clostridium sp.]
MFISSITTSTFGTVIGNADKISKKGARGYITEENGINMIHLNPKSSLSTYRPYTKESEVGGGIAKTLTLGALGLDLENTWSADSGNTVEKRFEKSGVQIVGGGAAWAGGKATEVLAAFGMTNLDDGFGEFCVGLAIAGDYEISKKISNEENYFYEKIKIK